MAPNELGPARESFSALGEEQLQLYASELQRHYRELRRLRKEFEDWRLRLEKRMRELHALRRMLSRHPNRQLSAEEFTQAITARLEETADEARQLAALLRSLGASAGSTRPTAPRSEGSSRT